MVYSEVQVLEKNFAGEIPGLGYPQAALFCFCLALVAYNTLAVIRRTIGSIHGARENRCQPF